MSVTLENNVLDANLLRRNVYIIYIYMVTLHRMSSFESVKRDNHRRGGVVIFINRAMQIRRTDTVSC